MKNYIILKSKLLLEEFVWTKAYINRYIFKKEKRKNITFNILGNSKCSKFKCANVAFTWQNIGITMHMVMEIVREKNVNKLLEVRHDLMLHKVICWKEAASPL